MGVFSDSVGRSHLDTWTTHYRCSSENYGTGRRTAFPELPPSVESSTVVEPGSERTAAGLVGQDFRTYRFHLHGIG